MKRRVFVSGPYTAPTREGVLANVRMAIRAGECLRSLGLSVFVPHLYDLWDQQHPHGYEFWMEMCLDEVERSDALYRFRPGSPGGNREEKRIVELERPILTTLEEVIAWLSNR
jgi:hypothetical protein